MNKKFNYNNCNIDIRFIPEDRFGSDRHKITISKAMLKPLSDYSFKENENEIIEYAKALTELMTCTCG